MKKGSVFFKEFLIPQTHKVRNKTSLVGGFALRAESSACTQTSTMSEMFIYVVCGASVISVWTVELYVQSFWFHSL